MQLEDVTAKFRYPCVTDIKIGAQTYDPNASQEKIAYEKRKCPQAAEIGFRLLGMKVKKTRRVPRGAWRNEAFESVRIGGAVEVLVAYYATWG